MSEFKPSKYQVAIFEEDKNTNNNIFIKAGPGSGKSWTLLEILKRTPFYKKSILLAFNKSIAEELKRKVPSGTDVSTIHSMAYRVLRQNTSNRYKLSDIKTYILAKKIIPNYYEEDKKNGQKLYSIYLFTISRIYDLYRMNLVNNDTESLIKLSDEYSVDYEDRTIKDTLKVIDYMDKYNSRNFKGKEMMIDFTDMLWLTYKLVSSDNFPKYDKVLCDEYQDVNPLQRETILKLISPKGKFIFVGDEKQSIYSFMGSNLLSFNEAQDYPNTTVLPLSVSYRCGKKIVEMANSIFPGLEAFEGNEDGIIRKGSISEIKSGDILLCRNNLPLIETFLELLGREMKTHIMGRDYGENLCNLIDKVSDIDDFDEILQKKEDSLKSRGVQQPIYHKSYVDLKEKVDIITFLVEQRGYSLYELTSLFKELFINSNDTEGVTLMTIHRSKGLENGRVFILGYDSLIPNQYAKTELERYSEKCVQYVALTRAKTELIFIDYKQKPTIHKI
jgi:DNA helicase-2/ATP-dependent DNA helicase PcrA